MSRWRAVLSIVAATLGIVFVEGAGLTVLGATDGAPRWAVDFDTMLVEHLPDWAGPWLYRVLGQGQYHDIQAINATLPRSQPATQPPSGCTRPAVPKRAGTLEPVVVHSSALDGAGRDLFVYLPPSYFERAAACWRYPVVYLLDGWPGSAADWFTTGQAQQTADDLIQQRTINEVILVSADGNGGLHQEPQWANAYDGRVQDETFLVRDVVGYVDEHFRTWADAQHRAVGGLSDGGFGAANIGLHHPEVFGAGMALSAVYLAPARWPFGPNPGYRRAYSPLEYIYDPPVRAAVRQQFWFLGAGSSDGIFFEQTRTLDRAFARLGIPHLSRYWPGGHSWKYWAQMLRLALPDFDRLFSEPAGTCASPANPPEAWPGIELHTLADKDRSTSRSR